MEHRCRTPSLYNPTFAGAIHRCRDCGQRWIFEMSMRPYRAGGRYERPAWKPISRGEYIVRRIDWTFVVALLITAAIAIPLYLLFY